ncbi:helix-turn-helix domain-containing protein [Streptomyces sp. NPDC049954]|uniref:helix-turn-helix domain-containing protein n=1 Tax=Streptomyces sp. NPDC049954 TaxID=3155779 RepID=UPI003445855A
MPSMEDTQRHFETLREQALGLRRQGLSRRQIRDSLHIGNNDLLNRLLAGEPAPEWTTRPNAKDELRARARELRAQGWTYDRIQAELGCSKSSVSLWVRDLPKPEPRYTREEQMELMREGLRFHREAQDRRRQETKGEAERSVGELTDRELFLVGVALYWAEGTKDKPHARRETVAFINSDPGVILTFLAWLDLMEVDRQRIRCSVMIHETADVAGAENYWAELVGAPATTFNKTVLKKHNPKTKRKNTGEEYRGCLVIKVLQSAELYRRIEGAWCGIVGAAHRSADEMSD